MADRGDLGFCAGYSVEEGEGLTDVTFVNPAGSPRPYVYALFQRT